jgi:hypothetical protein
VKIIIISPNNIFNRGGMKEFFFAKSLPGNPEKRSGNNPATG